MEAISSVSNSKETKTAFRKDALNNFAVKYNDLSLNYYPSITLLKSDKMVMNLKVRKIITPETKKFTPHPPALVRKALKNTDLLHTLLQYGDLAQLVLHVPSSLGKRTEEH